MVPKCIKHIVFPGIYRYERYFETEVDRESAKQLFPSIDGEGNNLSDVENKKQLKIDRLKNTDCIICIQPLGLEVKDDIMKMGSQSGHGRGPL